MHKYAKYAYIVRAYFAWNMHLCADMHAYLAHPIKYHD